MVSDLDFSAGLANRFFERMDFRVLQKYWLNVVGFSGFHYHGQRLCHICKLLILVPWHFDKAPLQAWVFEKVAP